MDIEHPAFHAKDGWTFKRLDLGSVRITLEGRPSAIEVEDGTRRVGIILDAFAWASVVASVSKHVEDYERHRQALEFHGQE